MFPIVLPFPNSPCFSSCCATIRGPTVLVVKSLTIVSEVTLCRELLKKG